MIFTDPRFILFFAAVFGCCWALRSNVSRKLFLLVVSYFFYGMWDWRFLSLIGISTVIDFLAGRQIARALAPPVRRFWLVVSLTTNLGLLGVFKYFNFFAGSLADLASWLGWPLSHTTLNIVLPVGISFYTFQSLSYTIDIYRGTLKPTGRLLDFALFVGFFPQLVAGPIVRAGDFLEQLHKRRVFSQVEVRACLVLFLAGFFKKACVADNVALLVDPFFANPSQYGCLGAWCVVCLYAMQIYCDFSGYSDMAIAAAGLLGYRLRANFNAPYLACNIGEFWRRWHMSLSSWLRDYVYISLGGNRKGVRQTYLNMMITMLLGGLWHGASWNFVLWGFIHGALLCGHRMIQMWPRVDRLCSRLPRFLAWALTLFCVVLAWIPFRSPDFSSSALIISQLFAPGWRLEMPAGLGYFWGLWWAIGLLLLIQYGAYRGWFRKLWDQLSATTFAAAYGLAWSISLGFMAADYQPFIYFQF